MHQDADGYKLIRQIGSGLAGPLWSADSPSGARVAIRRFTSAAPEGSEEWLAARAHFLQAANQSATLRQARVAQVMEVIDEGSEAWIVTEFLVGDTLDAVMAKERIPPEQVTYMLRVIALALDHAHQSGVVHGDLKPSNIFVGEKLTIRLTDFAVSPRARRNTRGAMPSAWVHSFLSPEHLLSPGTIGPKSDQYSLAAIAWYLYTGRIPFAEVGGDCGPAILRGLLTPASTVNRSLPKPIDAVISRALARDPGQRYSTCTEFIEELEAAMTPEPVPVPISRTKGSSSKLMYAGIASLMVALGVAGMLLRPSPKPVQVAAPPPVPAPVVPVTTPEPKPRPIPGPAPSSPRHPEVPASANGPVPRPVPGLPSPVPGPVTPAPVSIARTPLTPALPAPQPRVDPTVVYGPDVPKGLSLTVFSRKNEIPDGISFGEMDRTLGQMGSGDLIAEIRNNGPAIKGTLTIEWDVDDTPMFAAPVTANTRTAYRNEPSPGSYKVILRQNTTKVAEYKFRITP